MERKWHCIVRLDIIYSGINCLVLLKVGLNLGVSILQTPGAMPKENNTWRASGTVSLGLT